MMRKLLNILIGLTFLLVGILPIISLRQTEHTVGMFRMAVVLNGFGWLLVFVMWVNRELLQRRAEKIAATLAVDPRFLTTEQLLDKLFAEVARKNNAFLFNIIEGTIASKEDLAKSLQRVVSMAYHLLKAESSELALYDKDSGLYLSSFVMGKPFRVGAQAMLTDAARASELESSPDVMVEPLAFGGSILGTLRVGLPKGVLPTPSDRQIIQLLAIQGAIALVNAQYTQELFRMKHASDESVKAKTGFLANLSHEIRGPLGIILNAVELVLDGLCGGITEDQKSTLKMVQVNGAHLLELINDVLDYAKIESGKINVDPTDILVSELLTDLSAVVRAQVEAKHHKLICKPSDAALALCCDRRHARQMLINLLTNAIKYTPDGGTIELSAERLANNRVRINVKDSGVGISDEDRPKVFAAFERIENSYSITQVGTGLGMPLTAKLAEANGGSVDFESHPGKGSHFWISLPAVNYSPLAKVKVEAERVEAKGAGERILIIERQDGEREMLARYLTHLGFVIRAAANQNEALTLVAEGGIQLAVVDNNSLDQADENIVESLRGKAAQNEFPIVLVSSRAFVFDIEKYLRQGVDRCLTKPLALKDLGHICREIIDRARAGKVGPAAEAQTVSSAKVKSGALMVKGSTRSDDFLH